MGFFICKAHNHNQYSRGDANNCKCLFGDRHCHTKKHTHNDRESFKLAWCGFRMDIFIMVGAPRVVQETRGRSRITAAQPKAKVSLEDVVDLYYIFLNCCCDRSVNDARPWMMGSTNFMYILNERKLSCLKFIVFVEYFGSGLG